MTIAIVPSVTLRCVATKQTKKIPEAARQAFARELERWMAQRHEGNQTKAGKALGISQGHMSQLLSAERGPGLNTLIAMRLETGKSIDELLGYASSPQNEFMERLMTSAQVEWERERRKCRELEKRVKELEKELEAAKKADAAKLGPDSVRIKRTTGS